MLCRKNSVIFKAMNHVHVHFVHFGGVGITPKPPSGHHTSVGTMQQLERLALTPVSFCVPYLFKLKYPVPRPNF